MIEHYKEPVCNITVQSEETFREKYLNFKNKYLDVFLKDNWFISMNLGILFLLIIVFLISLNDTFPFVPLLISMFSMYIVFIFVSIMRLGVLFEKTKEDMSELGILITFIIFFAAIILYAVIILYICYCIKFQLYPFSEKTFKNAIENLKSFLGLTIEKPAIL
jgi:hypothetical protein